MALNKRGIGLATEIRGKETLCISATSPLFSTLIAYDRTPILSERSRAMIIFNHLPKPIDYIDLDRYKKLMLRCSNRELPPSEYYESHHIVPVSLDPAYGHDSFNLIKLTPREHYIAHLILWKAYGGAMATAFMLMSRRHLAVARLTGHQYESLKKAHALRLREIKLKQLATTGHWNKGRITPEAVRTRIADGVRKYYEDHAADRTTIDSRRRGKPIHDDEFKEKLRQRMIDNNPMQGSTFRFITDGITNKRWPVDGAIPEGWHLGLRPRKKAIHG